MNNQGLPETREEKHSVHLTVVRESMDSPFRRVDIVVVSMMDTHGQTFRKVVHTTNIKITTSH